MYTTFHCSHAAVFYNRKERLTMEQIQQRTGCTHILGGYVFNNTRSSPDYLRPFGWTVVDGVEVSRDPYNDWCFTCGQEGAPEMSVDKTADFVLSGVPILRDGAPITRGLTPDVARPAERQAVAWMPDGRILLWCSREHMDRRQLQERLLALGASNALMMDGGGSVQGSWPGGTLKSTRTLSTFLLFWEDTGKEPEKEEPMNEKKRVCLDAGHDAGNLCNASPDGRYYEHEFALDMAKRIKAILEKAGVEVVETRPDGRVVSLAERCRISNQAKPELFVSLHTNAAGGDGWSSARGWECCVYSDTGKGHQAAQAIQKRVDAVGAMMRPRPIVERPNLYVLKHTAAPAVLIEHGFHTSREDVALLTQKSYRALLAQAEAQGILDYLGVKTAPEASREPESPAPAPEEPHSPTEAEQAIRWITERGIMQGSADGDLMLEKPLTRKQFAVMLWRYERGRK